MIRTNCSLLFVAELSKWRLNFSLVDTFKEFAHQELSLRIIATTGLGYVYEFSISVRSVKNMLICHYKDENEVQKNNCTSKILEKEACRPANYSNNTMKSLMVKFFGSFQK